MYFAKVYLLFDNMYNHSLIWGLYFLKFRAFMFPYIRAYPKFELMGKQYFTTVHFDTCMES
jgi:hypothetical protein